MKEKIGAFLAWAGAFVVAWLNAFDQRVAPIWARIKAKLPACPAWAVQIAAALAPVWGWTGGLIWAVLKWLWSGVACLARNPAALACLVLILIGQSWHSLRQLDRLVTYYRSEIVTLTQTRNNATQAALGALGELAQARARIKSLEEDLGRKPTAAKADPAPAPAKAKKKGRG